MGCGASNPSRNSQQPKSQVLNKEKSRSHKKRETDQESNRGHSSRTRKEKRTNKSEARTKACDAGPSGVRQNGDGSNRNYASKIGLLKLKRQDTNSKEKDPKKKDEGKSTKKK